MVGIPKSISFHIRQSFTQHMISSHLAIRQSIMPCTNSILFWIEKLMKFVSTSIRYGGPRSVLWDKNSLNH